MMNCFKLQIYICFFQYILDLSIFCQKDLHTLDFGTQLRFMLELENSLGLEDQSKWLSTWQMCFLLIVEKVFFGSNGKKWLYVYLNLLT